MQLLPAARAAYAAGLCVLRVAADGSKRPDTPSGWRAFQGRRPTVEEMRAFDFAHCAGYGVVGGRVSGGIDPWDFDHKETFDAFVEAANGCGLGPIVAEIRAGYEDETPSGGRRWLVRHPPEVRFTDTVLARRPGRSGEPRVKTLIEITTFSILAPSAGPTHPTGRPYVRICGDFATIASYSIEERESLLELARSFDAMPRVEHVPAKKPKGQATNRPDLKPGEDFNQRILWPELLEPLGWTLVHTIADVSYWRRPGKTHGISATVNYGGSDLLYVFSSSTPFDPDKSYGKFGAYAVLHHGGDFSKAALALSRRGYGHVAVKRQESPGPDTSAQPLGNSSAAGGRTLQLTPASEIKVRPVRWLWEHRISLGTFVLLGGREDVGKTTVAYTLAASITQGTLPGVYAGERKAVIVAATEDSWEHTIVPRLMAADADLTRVYRVDVVTSDGIDTTLSLPRDLPALEDAVREVGAALVLLDPLLSRLDKALDTHKDAEVRIALEPLVRLSNATDTCVLGLIHVNKSASSDVLTLLMGSRAFTAVARSVLFVMVDPEDESHRLLGQPKNNLGSADVPTLSFRIGSKLVATTDEGDVWTGKLEWLGESDRSIRDAVAATSDHAGHRTATAEAADWLQDFLKSHDGVCDCALVQKEGRKAGHSKNTLFRARERLRITSETRGFPRKAYWRLPLFPNRPNLAWSRTTESAGPNAILDSNEQGQSAAPVDPVAPVVPVVPLVPDDRPIARSQDVPAHVSERVNPESGGLSGGHDEHRDERRF